MRSHRFTTAALLALSGAIGGSASAQTTAGGGTVIVLPLAASIPAAYTSTVFVRNPNPFTMTLNMRYYLSDSAAPVGTTGTPYCPNANSQISIAANAAITFDPAVQCNFPASNIFGMIVLEDVTSTYKTNTFFAYSRTEQPAGSAGPGNGFSVEGFPVGNFSAAPADSLGLRKTTAAPHYRSNCFVGALNESVTYQILLFQGETGALLGTVPASPATLGAYHTIRYLDVFTQAGLANQDYSNVRAKFVNSANSAMIGFCTMETTDNGSADFRIAKSADANDVRQSRLACYGMDSCGSNTVSATNPATITNASLKNIHYMIIDQPDFVKCDLVADAATKAALEITLRAPGDPLTAPVFTLPAGYNSAPYTSGGGGQSGFYVYTGEKSTISFGATTRWYVDVQRNAGSSATGPFNYGITCQAGNGVTVPWLGTTAASTP